MTGRVHLPDDWFALGLPPGVVLGVDCYVDTSYAFGAFRSEQPEPLRMGAGSGIYDRSNLVVGPRGRVSIGRYTCLNGTTVVAQDAVDIGSFCLLSWSVVISDDPCGVGVDVTTRASLMRAMADDPSRARLGCGDVAPVTIDDNVWIGFGSYVGPGVHIGRGAVIGSRSVVLDDIEPYAVAVGSPAKVIATLPASDSAEVVAVALRAFGREVHEWGAGAPMTGRIANSRGS